MECDLNGLRATLMETLSAQLKQSPEAQLHLIYIPELSDPFCSLEVRNGSIAGALE